MDSDGRYSRVEVAAGEKGLSCQDWLYRKRKGAAS
jgi:hypothetical protein